MPEQAQGYVLPATGQEIAIYYNHKYIATYARICKALLFALIALFIVFTTMVLLSALSPTLAQAQGSLIQSTDIPLIVISFAVILAAIAMLVWWNKLISHSTGPARKPVLHITSEGFRIQNAITARRRFIHWDELQTIYAHGTFLKIRSAAPLSTSNPVLLSHSRTTRISLIYLDTPGQEILRQLVQFYPNELSRYNIQFQP